ncbi:MAG: hypothetical protein HYV36_01180 [Lentisphaerae bacterium]|nr:hypothetical protein [Lentisphaerota bacterium]
MFLRWRPASLPAEAKQGPSRVGAKPGRPGSRRGKSSNVGTGSAVGKQMKQLVNERGKDRKLGKLMERIETGVKHTGS